MFSLFKMFTCKPGTHTACLGHPWCRNRGPGGCLVSQNTVVTWSTVLNSSFLSCTSKLARGSTVPPHCVRFWGLHRLVVGALIQLFVRFARALKQNIGIIFEHWRNRVTELVTVLRSGRTGVRFQTSYVPLPVLQTASGTGWVPLVVFVVGGKLDHTSSGRGA